MQALERQVTRQRSTLESSEANMKKLDVQISLTEERIKKIDTEIAELKKELDRNH